MYEGQDTSSGGTDSGYQGTPDTSGYGSSSTDYSGGADQTNVGYGGTDQSQTTDANPTTVSGMELMSGKAGLWSGTFYQRFKSCMSDMYMPAPDQLFSSFSEAVSTIKKLYAVVASAGEKTIGELIAEGLLGAEFAALGDAAAAVAASAYVGVCVGCLASAGIDYSGIF